MASNALLGTTTPQAAPLLRTENRDKNDSTFPVVNVDIIQGRWEEIKGKIKKRWGKITDDDLLQIEGSFQEIHGVLQTKYGYDKIRSEKEIKKFLKENNINHNEGCEVKLDTP
ncbi:MAG: CsbD family protein [Alphaproteobacteria bacterium]|nr:CsbD family protein [Alphaproteobacteria bacterium]